MNITFVPENMQYLFQNADHLLSQEDITLLKEKDARAKKLKKTQWCFVSRINKICCVLVITSIRNTNTY